MQLARVAVRLEQLSSWRAVELPPAVNNDTTAAAPRLPALANSAAADGCGVDPRWLSCSGLDKRCPCGIGLAQRIILSGEAPNQLASATWRLSLTHGLAGPERLCCYLGPGISGPRTVTGLWPLGATRIGRSNRPEVTHGCQGRRQSIRLRRVFFISSFSIIIHQSRPGFPSLIAVHHARCSSIVLLLVLRSFYMYMGPGTPRSRAR